jgi:signal transduction histidine kinase/PAS domain-containing protein
MILDLTTPSNVEDELSRRDELAERLRWLIKLRWVALGSVCIAIVFARLWELLGSVTPLVVITAAMTVLNIGFHGLHTTLPPRTLRALSSEALMQIAVDVIGLGLMLLFAGGLSNPFSFYFCFHVGIAAILLDKRQAYGVALLTSGVVFFLALSADLGLIAPSPLLGELGGNQTALGRFGMVFAISTTLVFYVYMVTAIMDRLRTHSRDVRRLNRDLGERVDMLAAAERKLAAEHQRARAILECMEEGVVVVDLHGKVMLANTAAQKSALLALDDTLQKAGCHEKPEHTEEYCHGPLGGENLLQHHHDHPVKAAECAGHGKTKTAEELARESCPFGNPSSCLDEALAKGGMLCPATLALLGGDPPRPQEQPVLTPPKSPKLAQIERHGRRFENTVSAVHTANNETMGLVIVSRDVTERRSLEHQVFHSEKLHALGNLAAGIAHELNTPLGTILGYAQILLDDEQKQSAPRELRSIEDQARRCRKIVQGLLDFARKSSGGREECAPNDLAIGIRDLMAHSLEMRGIELRVDLGSPPPPRVYVAGNEIEQVLVNLITNAADAIEQTTPVVAESKTAGSELRRGGAVKEYIGQVTIQTRFEPNAEVLIAVEDSGPGVPAQAAEQIFEPFFTTKAAGKGTGLGLSIARRIVEDHNGRLQLTSRPDGKSGARFEVWLSRATKRLVKN